MVSDVDRLYRSHGTAVYRFVRARMQIGDAEDVVSEVFLRALRTDTYDPSRGSERAWLMGIARTTTADQLRKRTRDARGTFLEGATPGKFETPDEPVEAALAAEEVATLHEHLAHLSEREQEALALRFGAEMLSEDVGAVLGISAPAARMLVHRALTKLRGVMA